MGVLLSDWVIIVPAVCLLFQFMYVSRLSNAFLQTGSTASSYLSVESIWTN